MGRGRNTASHLDQSSKLVGFYCLCNSGEADLPWFSSGYSADNIYLTGSGKLTGMVYPVPSIEQTLNRGQGPFFFSPDI